MAIGWTDDDAVLDQIQDSVNDEVNRARRTFPAAKACCIAKNAAKRFPKRGAVQSPASDCALTARKRRTNRTKPSVSTTAAVQKTASSNNFLSFNYSLIKLF